MVREVGKLFQRGSPDKGEPKAAAKKSRLELQREQEEYVLAVLAKKDEDSDAVGNKKGSELVKLKDDNGKGQEPRTIPLLSVKSNATVTRPFTTTTYEQRIVEPDFKSPLLLISSKGQGSVIFSEAATATLLAAICNLEVSFYGAVRQELGGFYVDELHWLPQSNTGGSTVLGGEVLARHITDHELYKEPLHFWLHTHGAMSAFWSTTDEKTIAGFVEAPSAAVVAIVVGQKDGGVVGKAVYARPQFSVELTVQLTLPFDARVRGFLATELTQVKQVSVVHTHSVGATTYQYGPTAAGDEGEDLVDASGEAGLLPGLYEVDDDGNVTRIVEDGWDEPSREAWEERQQETYGYPEGDDEIGEFGRDSEEAQIIDRLRAEGKTTEEIENYLTALDESEEREWRKAVAEYEGKKGQPPHSGP